jgi:hypothetical protein
MDLSFPIFEIAIQELERENQESILPPYLAPLL